MVLARPRLAKVVAGAAVGAVALVMSASAAVAHVSISPSDAPQGGFEKLSFRVPNEQDDAATVKVEIQFPADHPIAFVTIEPLPGWTYEVTKTKLAAPLKTEDGEVSEAVSTVTWSGGQIKPGEFGEFSVSAGPLPTDATTLEFKAIQTYDNGDVTRWIEPTPPSGEEPERPAPTLTLTKAEGDHGSSAGDSTGPSSSDVDSAKRLGLIGIIVGALGLVAGGTALATRRRPS